MATITRHPYALARKQVESTGLDRFFSLVVPPPEGRFDPLAQLGECFRLLETAPAETALVAPGRFERSAAERAGAVAVTAAWAVEHDPGGIDVTAPGQLLETLLRRWEGRLRP